MHISICLVFCRFWLCIVVVDFIVSCIFRFIFLFSFLSVFVCRSSCAAARHAWYALQHTKICFIKYKYIQHNNIHMKRRSNKNLFDAFRLLLLLLLFFFFFFNGTQSKTTFIAREYILSIRENKTDRHDENRSFPIR